MPDTPLEIDFNSPIAYYIQLERILRHQIETGVYASGTRLPSEPELCRTYDVSRTVVRHALRELERAGLIYKRKGKGSFVSEGKITESLVQKLTGFYTDMVEQGYEPTTEVLLQTVLPANAKIASRLNIPTGENVIAIERIRSINDSPIVYVITYLVYQKCKAAATADLTARSLYQLMETECGVQVARGHRSIGATLASEKVSKYLNVPQRTPLILLESVGYLRDDTPIEFYRAFHRGDKSKFRVELVRSRQMGTASIPALNADDFPDISPGNQFTS